MMIQFLLQHHVPGASLAITRYGKLVYARSFGWADRDARQPVQPQSLFRIASISKSFTAVAVMRLVQDGAIKLDDRPFPMPGLTPLSQPGQTPDPRLAQITVLELLQHRGGFDRELTPDPMTRPIEIARLCGVTPPAMPDDIIRFVEGRSLDFAPGERVAYSNFGYCILGRLIEKASGESYAQYVKTKILEPLGIHSRELARTQLQYRAPSEVKYYTADNELEPSCFPPIGNPVPAPYGSIYIESQDSCGGWLASAMELVRFQSSFEDPTNCPILNVTSMNQLFARPPGALGLENGKPVPAWTACGWSINQIGTGRYSMWKTGRFAGTSAMMEHQPDDIDWAILFNQDTDNQGTELTSIFTPLLHKAINSIDLWPMGIDRTVDWQ
jgi:N-acyl-D-amino-acid deacylase